MIEEIDRLTSPVYKKIEREEPLGEGDLILLFIERLFYLDWSSKGKARGGFDLRFRREIFKGEIKKILVLQPSSIGDVVYTTPLLSGLRETYPHAKITYIVERTALDVVRGNPNLDRVIIMPRERWVKDLGKGDLKGVLKKIASFIKELQSIGFDLVVNLHAAPRCAILTHLAKGKNTSGLTIDEFAHPIMMGSTWIVHKYYITTNQPMQDLRRLSLPELYMKIGGVNPNIREETFPLHDEVLKRMKEKMRSLGIKDGDLVVGIVPGGNFPSRRWPPKRYGELADRLIRYHSLKILILGGKEDRGLGEEIYKVTKGEAINLCGKTTLKELGAVLSMCDHVITNDTGPMHIAGALHTRSIVIAGPTRTGPYGGDGHLLLQADLPCVGCGPTSACTKGECMEAIEVDMVIDAFRYQVGQMDAPPRFPGVNLYTSGKSPPNRLFSYAPLERMEGDASMDLLSLYLVDLWIRENNRLGYYERPLTQSEIEDEVRRHWSDEAILNGKKTILGYISEWKERLGEGIRYLERMERGDGTTLDAYNRLNKRFNRTLGGRVLSFLDILYPVEGFENEVIRSLALYRLKLEACRRMENLILSKSEG